MKYLFCTVLFFAGPLGSVCLAATPREVREARPPEFVDALSIEPLLSIDMIYFGADNFVGRPINGYQENRCLLLKSAANALKKAEARLVEQGKRRGKALTLLLRDCYRPQKATEDFLAWLQDASDLKQREKFYPRIAKSEIVKLGYLSAFSGHSRGATVDLTIAERGPNGSLLEIDMGSPLDFFGPISRMDSREVSAAASANRRLLARVMGPEFRNYEKEWWHYTLYPEPNPRRAYNFNVTAPN